MIVKDVLMASDNTAVKSAERKIMKTQSTCFALVVCLGVVSTAFGQTPQSQPLVRSGSNGTQSHLTSEQLAKMQQSTQLGYSAASDLHLGNYAQAETEARETISTGPMTAGFANEVLAAALDAQGKDKEALEAYRVMVVDQKASYPRVLLPYAQLLLKSGHWAQALAVYNQVLPYLPDVGPHPETPVVHDGNQISANSHFSPDVPEPAALATALHTARGLVYNSTPTWSGESQDTEAMAEYGKALQGAPDNALANYYYGVGWHKLSPAERVKFGHAAEAKAALQKAALTGNGDVKKMAEETLKKAK